MSHDTHNSRRILIIDDQQSIHDDFDKILVGGSVENAGLDNMRAAFFGADEAAEELSGFELVHALQGEQGIELHAQALAEGRPFSVAFVDIRMPPGLDGVQTIAKLWEADTDLQTVICTAYSDYSFEDIVENLGQSDRLLILKKPFDPVEVRQLSEALSSKWNLIGEQREQLDQLNAKNLELQIAERAAQSASRAKSQFLTNMSHEIRTPLNAMLGFVDFVCDDAASAEDREKYEQTIRDSGDHLMRLLDEVLDLARIEAQKIVLAQDKISPLELAREAAWIFVPQASKHDLKLNFRVKGALPLELSTDRSRAKQILIQLLGNALKFTTKGEISIELSATESEMCWSVTDTGPGIALEEQCHIFEAFHQTDNSLTRTSGGLGLGLALVRRLAGLLGGRVEVESVVGKGSRFSFMLPTGGATLVAIPAEECTVERRMASKPRCRELEDIVGRVLIVEDVKLNRVLLTKILRKAGATVSSAENGLEGVESARAARKAGEPFDLILMDMQMPVMDGYTAASTLREEGDSVPIIALTAHAMKGDRERCLEAGCDDYATKPIDRAALVSLCRGLMSGELRNAA